MNCRHCGKRITKVNWALGPGWMHEYNHKSLCEHLSAEPPPNTCACGWVGEGECPRDPSDHTEQEVDLMAALRTAVDAAKEARQATQKDFALSPEPRYMETLDELERRGD